MPIHCVWLEKVLEFQYSIPMKGKSMAAETRFFIPARFKQKMRGMAFLILVGITFSLGGCFDFTGKGSAKRELLSKQRDALIVEVKKNAVLLNERDILMQKYNNVQAQLEQVEQLVKALSNSGIKKEGSK